MVACVGVRNFWLFLVVFVPISCFKLVFLRKAIMSCELLNTSLKLLSRFNICLSLFIILIMFSSTELYVAKNGIETLRFGLHFFKSNDLSRWPTLSICFLTVDCSTFQQIFLLGIGTVSYIPPNLNICT